ncbi:hypothetical protein [Nesterenkonia halobia]
MTSVVISIEVWLYNREIGAMSCELSSPVDVTDPGLDDIVAETFSVIN